MSKLLTKNGKIITKDGDGFIAPIVSTQSKTVTPTREGLTVTPDSGNVLSSVKVNGDANLVASNIKKGSSIFGVSGSSVVVDTSDVNATENDLPFGKTAYVNGEKITGWGDAALPSAYQKVEYIETNSSHPAIINSGVQLAEDYGIFDIEAVFELNGWFENASYAAIFSSADHRYSIHFRHSGQQEIYPEVGWYNTTYPHFGSGIPLNTRLQCHSTLGVLLNNDSSGPVRNFSVIRYNNKPEISVHSNQYATTTTYTVFGMPQPFGIFGRYNRQNSYSYRTGAKMYRLRVWQNGVLIRDYYPCYRKTDVAIGLYDIVGSQLYLPENSATFLKGSNV